jgi:hypothetical protein
VSESQDLSPSIHRLICQAVCNLVVFAESMTDLEVFEPPQQLLRFIVQLAEFGMPHLVDAFHLADHQFGIADHLERFDLVFGGVTESGQESLILGVVVGAVSKVFAEFGDGVAGGVLNSDTIAGGAGIAAGSAIDVSSVSGGRGFRRGEKIAGIGKARGHKGVYNGGGVSPARADLKERGGEVPWPA